MFGKELINKRYRYFSISRAVEDLADHQGPQLIERDAAGQRLADLLDE